MITQPKLSGKPGQAPFDMILGGFLMGLFEISFQTDVKCEDSPLDELHMVGDQFDGIRDLTRLDSTEVSPGFGTPIQAG